MATVNILIRDVPKEIADALSALASLDDGKDRMTWIRELLVQAASIPMSTDNSTSYLPLILHKKLLEALTERTQLYESLTDEQRNALLAETVRSTLEDYYQFIALSLPKFSSNEAMLLVDAMNGCIVEPFSAQILWANIADAVEMDGLDAKWDVDGPALVTRLRELGRSNPFACWAIADAIKRAWNSTTYHIENMEEKVRQVGLVREDKQQ